MSTISESPALAREEHRKLYIQQYIQAKPLSIDDSLDVLRARLFGLGLRGEDLRSEVYLAEWTKLEQRRKRYN